MAEYEKDFMLRQAKQMADLLGSFMDKESAAEIIEFEQEQGQTVKNEKHQHLLEELRNHTNKAERRTRPLIKRRMAK
ncbi:hypothetical protein [Enterococcus sp. BWR-S5]|uniref:hypothetical protein n=1 Tax=Enterococcus sp. BWR-S5 TaxID=2787714 RepID=UPI0019215CB7|nr:hypothetical protein [Enterococcus sp. BWR-S5]MBL1227423.1 hypothetical protein [Enterococcus sp. BWR-S5]